jgi:transposase
MRYNTKTEVSEMERVPKGVYTREFKEEAVKLVMEAGLSVSEVAQRLSVGKSTIEYWVRKAREGSLSDQDRKAVSAEEMEMSRLRREVAELKMEREILKKAAAYFAKESLRGTR